MEQGDGHLGHLGTATYFGLRNRASPTDAVGNQAIAINARGNANYFVCDSADQPTAATDLLGRTTHFAYHAAGNLATQGMPNVREVSPG